MKDKNSPKQLTTHHRKPQCKGGTNDESNLVKVPRNKHEAYHFLFNEGDVNYIAKVLTETWVDPEYEVRIVKKK